MVKNSLRDERVTTFRVLADNGEGNLIISIENYDRLFTEGNLIHVSTASKAYDESLYISSFKLGTDDLFENIYHLCGAVFSGRSLKIGVVYEASKIASTFH